ncbi:germination protein YpeB [Clostridium sp. SYSU_GA19001]|uniref:germination protein YpeB n=1 Tax=Clostridium caldaquaticum TaxID=2940653 RepID=UPI0020774AE6|nr:germination protein YpeB [Clostridium caldaquaticum]MCM8709711.1 germination protein YpeB [Clostridium caldaquaticum]
MKMTKKRIIYTIAVTLIVVFSTTFAVLMTLERNDYRNYLQGEYSKNMYELITAVDNIRVNLGKAAVTGSREQKIVTFQEIFRHSAIANDKLHSLPIPQQNIDNTSKFISQVGDFCYSLVRASTEGRDLTEEEYNNIDRLKNDSFNLQNDLTNALMDINEGRVKWGEIRQKASGVFAKSQEENLAAQFQGIQKQVAQYPALIYDGPFSDNVLEIKPKVLSQKEISVNEATEVVYKAIGRDKIEKIENLSNDGKTRIPSYRFNVTMKGREVNENIINIEISKNGGKIVYLLDNRLVNNPTIDMQKAIDIGSKYLENLGYKNMISTYSLRYDNTAVINYIYKQNDVVIYPDQIKLKIAMDDGSILGVECEKYLVAHDENRNIETPKISKEEARTKVSKRLNITTARLAIIPTESNKEVLCYEFVGNYKEDKYIIYINAKTGFEQRIIQIINTPNGELTM